MQIHESARRRWDQLEADPVLAGPWHQLFRQVQSPRHVLSELLQNADDANATAVKATITEGKFEFVHNGDDFTRETLQSLCQFGLSNKRHLHTIGFRGIGFKSVFSLGQQVEVVSPTLSFAFNHRRFTEPIWVPNGTTDGDTLIRIKIDQGLKEDALHADLMRWVRSPIPLLFFQNIQRLEIQGQSICREVAKAGPSPDSYYVRLFSGEEKEVLIAVSKPEIFPEEALQEVREERGSTDFELPPCTVQLVIDNTSENGRLFTVLPTDVQTLLPFSFNAPFIQDPARKEIKHPANSYTNRWLLGRIGKLAAHTMLQWLTNSDLSLSERGKAYTLFPDIITSSGSLNDVCTKAVVDAFQERLKESDGFLLGHDGQLHLRGTVAALPQEILQTWDAIVAKDIFAPEKEALLAQEVEAGHVERLGKWKMLDSIDLKRVARRLISSGLPNPPLPTPLERLCHLWAFLHPLSIYYWGYEEFRQKLLNLSIVPVENKNELSPAEEVIPLGKKHGNRSQEENEFLFSWVDVVSRSWIEFLTIDNTKEEKDIEHDPSMPLREKAADLFTKMKLHQSVGMEQVIDVAGKKIFSKEDPGRDGVRLAYIAATNDVRVYKEFRFKCQDGEWRAAESSLMADTNGDLRDLLPPEYFASKVISFDYENSIDLRTWHRWASDYEKSMLASFPLPHGKKWKSWGRGNVEKFCTERGGQVPTYYPYTSDNFFFEDTAWDDSLWSYWKEQAANDPSFWQRLISAIFKSWGAHWEKLSSARISQSWGSNHRSLSHGDLRADWLQKISSLSCIHDAYGRLAFPAELFRRTPETEPLLNVERFVHPDLDKPEHANLLDMIGTRNHPAGVDPLIERLKALSGVSNPPIGHLFDLYRAIDRVLVRMDDRETIKVQEIFCQNLLVFTSQGIWENLLQVFKENPEDIPGVCTIHSELLSLGMWDRMGLKRRPSLEMALDWLKSKGLGELLQESDHDRARQILSRAPDIVWQQCEAWLNLKGIWTHRRDFRWATAGQTAIGGLYDHVKLRTADFSMLDDSKAKYIEMTGLTLLQFAIQNVPVNKSPSGKPYQPKWLLTLSEQIARISGIKQRTITESQRELLQSDKETAIRLFKSSFQPLSNLRIAPYIEGECIGTETVSKAIWDGDTIFAVGKSPSHHRELVEELVRHFRTPAIIRTIEDCAGRDPDWIVDYIAERFDLGEGFGDIVKESDEKDREKSGAEKEQDELVIEETEVAGEDEGQEMDIMDIEDRRQRKDRRNQLLEGFMSLMIHRGFRQIEKDVFGDDMQHRVRRAERPFHWVEHDMRGVEMRKFWVGHGDLAEGLEIPAALWNMPLDSYEICICLLNENNAIATYSLSEIKQKASDGKVAVTPVKLNLKLLQKG